MKYSNELDISIIPKDILAFFQSKPYSLLYTIGNVGKGKTLFFCIFALCYSIFFKDNIIDANYPLKLKNFCFNPYSFFPYDNLNNRLIQIDDCNEIKKYSKIITIASKDRRKKSLYILLSAQYPKDVAKALRDTANYYFEVELTNLIIENTAEGIKERLSNESKMIVSFYKPKNEIEMKFEFYMSIKNPLKLISLIPNIYDTEYKTQKPLEKYVILEIIKYSDNFNDIKMNLDSYFDNKRDIISIYKKLLNYSFKEVKQLNDIDIESILYKIPRDILEKRKKEGSL